MDNPDYREMLQLFDMEELKEDRVNIGVDRGIASLISELLGDVKEKSKKWGSRKMVNAQGKSITIH